MLIRKLSDCKLIVAGDNTNLRELIHPRRSADFHAGYSLAHATLAVGAKSSRHRMKTDEVYYILSGSGEMHINDETANVTAGDCIHIPPGSEQWIRNIGDGELAFLCIVAPAWDVDDELILE